MVGDQILTEFNYIVNIRSDQLDNINTSNIDDVNVGNDPKYVKENLKNRIARTIVQSFDSIGSLHLKGDSFDSSNNRQSSTTRSVHFGGSSGITTNLPDSYIVQFRLGITTFVDHKSDQNPRGKRLWKKIKRHLEDENICIDTKNEIYGQLELCEPRRFNWNADAIRRPENIGHTQTSEIEKSQNPNINQTIESDYIGTGFGLDGHTTTDEGIDLEKLDSNVDPEDPYNNYTIGDSISEIEQTYNRYQSDSVKVRKPTENEITEIRSAVYQRIKKIFNSDQAIYLDEIPEEWENATCSRCKNKSDNLVVKFQDKYEEVIKHRLDQDFGIGSNSDTNFKDSMTTNYFITETGDILFRPEEIISWVISISNHVEPYCNVCHSEVGGKGHKEFTEELVITRNKDGSIESTDDPVNSSLNVNPPSVKSDSISIDKDNIDDNTEYYDYRSPTDEEIESIDRSITDHLLRLSTRLGEMNTESNAVYNTLYKRDRSQEYNKKSYNLCSSCKSPVVKPESDRINLRSFQKHHIEPMSGNRVTSIIRKIRDLLDKANGTNAQYSPIKVSEKNDHYLFSDKFVSLVEILYRNVDTVALFCEDCDAHMCDKEEGYSYQFDSNTMDEKESKTEDSMVNIFEISYDVSSSSRVEFRCLMCKKRNNEKIDYTADAGSDRCFVTLNGRRHCVPILTENRIYENLAIGLCPEHKNECKDRIDAEEISGDTEKQKIQNLMERSRFL
jgi:hypothetical protein